MAAFSVGVVFGCEQLLLNQIIFKHVLISLNNVDGPLFQLYVAFRIVVPRLHVLKLLFIDEVIALSRYYTLIRCRRNLCKTKFSHGCLFLRNRRLTLLSMKLFFDYLIHQTTIPYNLSMLQKLFILKILQTFIVRSFCRPHSILGRAKNAET